MQYQKAAPRPQLSKPVYVEQRQQQVEPQYYDYEQEQPQQAPKHVQFRSKYQEAPQSPHQAPIDIVYAPQIRQQQRPVQHGRHESIFDDRQPQIFPEQAPAPVRQAQPSQLFTSAPKQAKVSFFE